MIIISLLIVLLIFIVWFNKHRKKIVVSQVNLITGAPKTGKTLTALYLAHKDYKKRVFKTKIQNFFLGLLNKPLKEMPLFYSTIPVGFPYVEMNEDLLLRHKRFNYNSVIFVDETYLVADSTTCKDDDVNERLSYLCKLIGHELRGGSMFLNTQNVHDLHFAFKRVATTYIFLTQKRSFPFFMNIKCRELVNTDEVPVMNIATDDIADDPSFHNLFIPKSYFKKYDCYAYSCLTDNLPVVNDVKKPTKDKKTDVILCLKRILKDKKGVN